MKIIGTLYKNYKMDIVLFFGAFSSLIISNFFTDTTFILIVPNFLVTTLKLFALILIFAKILLSRYSLKSLIFLLFSIGTLFIYFLFNRSLDFILLFLLIFSAKNIEFDKIVKFFFYLVFLLLFIVVCFSLVGILPNYIYTRADNIRMSLGTQYPTILGSYFFYLMCSLIYIFRNIRSISLSLILGSLAIFIDYLTDARAATTLVLLLALIQLLKSVNKNVFFNFISRLKSLIFFVILCIPVASILLPYFYTRINPDIATFLNVFFSNRIALGSLAFINYPISFFGTNIIMNGYGGGSELSFGESYFYLDALYVWLLFSNGIIGLILYVTMFIGNVRKSIRNNNLMLLVIFGLISLMDFVDNKSFRISYNPFILYFFSNIYSTQSEEMRNFEH